jgi:ABC-2 type transport system ATP-binding protein
MIAANNITKTFDSAHAIHDVSINVNKGELYGVIGPDGAGKTTLFRILITLLLADSGSASIYGLDVVKDFKRIRQITGYMPGRFSLYQDLTVYENLRFYASVFGTTIEENYDLVKDIYSHIEPFKNRPAGKLSGGMKQKLALSCALIHAPKLLVLDEPTTGVDAVSRTEFWQMLKKLQQRDITIIVSTPYMDEASLCDRVALMQEGKMLAIDSPASIVDSFDKNMWAIRAPEKYLLIQALRAYPGIDAAHSFGDSVHVTTKNDKLNQQHLVNFLSGEGVNGDIDVIDENPTIEDCFLQLLSKA